MIKLISLLLPAILYSVCVSRSQDPPEIQKKPELPSGPVLRAPGNFARWQITSTYPDEQKKKDKPSRKSKKQTFDPGVRLRKLVTTKTGQIIHEERTDVREQASEVWFDAAVPYFKSTGSSVWFRGGGVGTPTEPGLQPPPAIGFRNVEIIREENFVTNITRDNRDCLVFVPGGQEQFHFAKKEDVQKKLKGIEAVAYVDSETRLPVEVRTRNETRTFQYDPPPTKMQTLPPDLLAQIKKGDDARAHLYQPAPRPN